MSLVRVGLDGSGRQRSSYRAGGGLVVLAIVAPGQGAQSPGFLAPWLEVPAAAEMLRLADAVTGLELIRLGTEGDADEIRDTAIAQPLLVAAALASAAALDLVPAAGSAPDPHDRLF